MAGFFFVFWALSATADIALFELRITPDEIRKIDLDGNLQVVQVGGKSCLYLQGKSYYRFRLPADLTRFANKRVQVSYTYRLKNVPEPDVSWNGFKVMIACRSGNQDCFGHAKTPWGTCDWTSGTYDFQFRENPSDGKVTLAIPGGEAWLSSFAVHYSDLPVDGSIFNHSSEDGGGGAKAGISLRKPLSEMTEEEMKSITANPPALPEPSADELEAVAFTALKKPLDMLVSGPNFFTCKAVLPDGKVLSASFTVSPVKVVPVENEVHSHFPVLDPWEKRYSGASCYRGLRVGELTIRSGIGPDAVVYTSGKDYIESPYGIGRTPDSAIQQLPVYFSYSYLPSRCDSVILANNKLLYKTGSPAQPLKGFPRFGRLTPPETAAEEVRLANIYIPSGFTTLKQENLFPIMETGYPIRKEAVADQLLPETMKRLRSGGTLRILAWGDSITAAGFEPGLDAQWQNQVVHGLRRRFPAAQIELITEAWGGRGSGHYLTTKPCELHNFQTSVLDKKPDLVISHWHNDGLDWFLKYPEYLRAFKEINAEWLPVTAYVNSLEMNHQATYARWTVAPLLIHFASENGLPVADCAARTQRLWRQGIPRMIYSAEGQVHPGIPGMKLIADSVLEIFPEQ